MLTATQSHARKCRHHAAHPQTRQQEERYETTVPTVGDRIAQTVVALTLEPRTEAIFHADSYGYRPGKSAHDALAVCRKRCWAQDWVLDLDVRAFFDRSAFPFAES